MREHQGTKKAEGQAEASGQRGGSMPAVAAFQMKTAGAFGEGGLPESEMELGMEEGPVQMKGHMAVGAAIPVVQRVVGSMGIWLSALTICSSFKQEPRNFIFTVCNVLPVGLESAAC